MSGEEEEFGAERSREPVYKPVGQQSSLLRLLALSEWRELGGSGPFGLTFSGCEFIYFLVVCSFHLPPVSSWGHSRQLIVIRRKKKERRVNRAEVK